MRRATRARVLCHIAATPGHTTSELSRRPGTSPSSASAHAQALHRAGLITSTRHANMVTHRATGLGAALIRPAAAGPGAGAASAGE
ncbi:MarR family transcriptional regulator [Nonomuraea fuscirosea]|uniref:ArsR/SmtB family transcription factor n=1 Tax=Nonomuraea fuscirosea TaxID=1291556 RepID=UPI00343BDC7F